MTARTSARIATALAFVACIIAANYATARFGFIPVWWGVTATAGTLFAGLAFLARDAVQDVAGRRAVVALIVVGAGLSWWLSTPQLALASGVAFLVSELTDMAVYTPLRAWSWTAAVLASNTVGALLDSVVFLTLAHFPVAAALPGQMIGKVGVTLVTLAVAAAVTGVVRHRRVTA